MKTKGTPMVELSKKILKQVSFDANLFQKELKKAISWIQSKEDLIGFRLWCINNFGSQYPREISVAFAA